jgi:hypothetical protein
MTTTTDTAPPTATPSLAEPARAWEDSRLTGDPRIDHEDPVVRAAAQALHHNESIHLHTNTLTVCVYCALRASRVVRLAREALRARPGGSNPSPGRDGLRERDLADAGVSGTEVRHVDTGRITVTLTADQLDELVANAIRGAWGCRDCGGEQ